MSVSWELGVKGRKEYRRAGVVEGSKERGGGMLWVDRDDDDGNSQIE